MGTTGANRNIPSTTARSLAEIQREVEPEIRLRDRTNDVDNPITMEGSYFSNAAVLVATINRADGGRFDILNNTNNGDYGSILYTDSYGNEGDAYEVDWQRDYSDPERIRIRVIRFKPLEEGEW